VINDAMYSDSPDVVDALAQLVETLVAEAVQTPVPFDRMNQVRHIIQVDESSFQSRFSLDQLKVIEIKEMEAIVGDLVSAVGLQRFRFIMRQNAGTWTASSIRLCFFHSFFNHRRRLTRLSQGSTTCAAIWLESLPPYVLFVSIRGTASL
jgi:hypothetical protein